MPVYNERSTLRQIIQKVLDVPLEKELIIVDDGSTDGSREILKEYEDKSPDIKVIFHEKNSGKGRAIRTGLEHISGDMVIIQDADLETDPNDYLHLVEPIRKGETKVVYGSRLLQLKKVYNLKYYLGGQLVTWVANLLYGQNITDEPTCYKVFDAEFLKSIPLDCEGFEFCAEITAKVSKRGEKIVELPMKYFPRETSEGKKLRWTDGLEAVWTLLKYKFKKNV